MASDCRSCAFSSGSFQPYKSYAFGAYRTGSLRLRPPPAEGTSIKSSPVSRLKATASELSTVNLLKSITATQKSKSQRTTAPVDVQSTTKSTLGANKSYYSSTRSFSSKIVDRNQNQKLSTRSTAISSSGNSSIESIASSHCNPFVEGTKKRIYSSVRITKKELPYTGLTSTPFFTSSTNKLSKDRVNDNLSSNNSNSSSTSGCTLSSLSSSTTSFSKKFPNGLPFEDEFYNKRRHSISTKSEVSDYGSYENDDSDRSLLPFEEEFAGRRPSNEIYVDFSKQISPHRFSPTTTRSNRYQSQWKQTKNRVCGPNEVIVQDQPTIYVAVKWWALHDAWIVTLKQCKLNKTLSLSITFALIALWICKNNFCHWKFQFYCSYDTLTHKKKTERSKRSHHRRSPTSSRRGHRRHREERSQSTSRRRHRERAAKVDTTTQVKVKTKQLIFHFSLSFSSMFSEFFVSFDDSINEKRKPKI